MFDGGGDDVGDADVALATGVLDGGRDGVVVALGSAGREDDLGRVASSMRATCARAVSTAFLHGAAKTWPLEGLPKCSQRKGSIAAATSGKMGVVAL